MEVITTTTGYTYPAERYEDENRTDQRKVNGQRKGHRIAEMWESHHEIARMIVLGHKNVDIADELGVSAQMVSNVRNSPVVQEKVALLRAVRDGACIDLAKEVAEMAPMAVKLLREALTTGKVFGQQLSGNTIMKEVNNLLDRQMGKAIQRVDSRNMNLHLGPDDINRIKERARQLAPRLEGE